MRSWLAGGHGLSGNLACIPGMEHLPHSACASRPACGCCKKWLELPQQPRTHAGTGACSRCDGHAAAHSLPPAQQRRRCPASVQDEQRRQRGHSASKLHFCQSAVHEAATQLPSQLALDAQRCHHCAKRALLSSRALSCIIRERRAGLHAAKPPGVKFVAFGAAQQRHIDKAQLSSLDSFSTCG